MLWNAKRALRLCGVRVSRPGCRDPSRALAHEGVVTEDGPHPPDQLGAVAARYGRSSFSPSVPLACHSQRS
jgi:hypothetical protein